MREFIQRKRNILLVVIGLFIIVLSASFAFFAIRDASPATTNVDVGASTNEKLIFTEGTPISLRATMDNFADGDGSLSGSTTSNAKLIANSEGDNASRNYQVYVNIISNDYVYTRNNTTPELILKVVDPTGTEVTSIDGLTHYDFTDASGQELSGFDITEYEGLIKVRENNNLTTNTEISEDWSFTITFVNLDTLQTANEGKTLNSEIILQEEKILNLNEYIITNHTEADGLYQHTSSLANSDQSGDYRYSGSNAEVNNHISFNDETWRIIGVFDIVLADGTTTEQLVKIIREESIGTYEWDVSNINDWTFADLNILLNDNYLNSTVASIALADCGGSLSGSCDFTTNGIKSTYLSYIEEVIWNLGGADTYNQTTSEFYIEERGTTVYTGRPTETTDKVGLMYVSDYGYAAPSSCWTTNLYNYDVASECYDGNWLFKGVNERTVTAHSASSNNVWCVSYDGSVSSYRASNGYASRPVLYLKASTGVLGGTGSVADPFHIN